MTCNTPSLERPRASRAAVEDIEPPAPRSSAEAPSTDVIDLSAYGTTELVEELTELISVPHALRRIAFTTAWLALAVVATCALVFAGAGTSGPGWLLLSAYGLVAGFVLGVMLGVVRVVSTALRNVEDILGIVLDVTGRAAGDFERLRAGSVRLPSFGVLIAQVYDRVLLPGLERAAGRAFGVLATPIFWVYRRSIGAVVRRVVNAVAREAPPVDFEQQVERGAGDALAGLAGHGGAIESSAASARRFVSSLGCRLRTWALWPLYLMFATAAAVALGPVVLARVW